jgi:hypothetical protein
VAQDTYTIDLGFFRGKAGFPAPKNMSVYIFSSGPDRRINQPFAPDYESLKPEDRGGGDDINSWDHALTTERSEGARSVL